MQILGLSRCHRFHVTIKNESVSYFLVCFVFLGQEIIQHPNFHPLHLNSTFNRNRIEIMFYISIWNKKKKLTLCAFDHCLANKIPKCGENILKILNLKVEISSMKLGPVS